MGRAGDDKSGFLGYLSDQAVLARVMAAAGAGAAVRLHELRRVAAGNLRPIPHTRLGAFAATVGYPRGTVGYAVNRAIGLLYASLGTYGEERIGVVFNSPIARTHYPRPVHSASSRAVAQMEFDYWAAVRAEDPWSAGGRIATAFDPGSRDWLQREVFTRSP
ncbi:MAG: hypothetical protein IPH07_16395 [Deltaproteobacteria bacterium]|nr:hypothetical protein [Deltaproteobacteria bacterium]MBK8239361.1 hypothetical protein [Deltaproteobacteria bacterium]MBK8720300.1 hypothetical protein [Deltaproteobacteria bacterium]MBP7291502.1 hypothetical protein [Nannocystaceae bacterium]